MSYLLSSMFIGGEGYSWPWQNSKTEEKELEIREKLAKVKDYLFEMEYDPPR